MENTDGKGAALSQDYNDLIAKAEEMLRDARKFYERLDEPDARLRMEELLAKMEADVERYRRAQERQRGF